MADYDISPQFRHDSGFVNQVGMRDIEAPQGAVFRNLAPTNERWVNLRPALATDNTLVTRNDREFRPVVGLRVQVW